MEVLEHTKLRRVCKIFKIMSEWMLENGFSKDSEQCRGHHKKFTKKYGDIPNIIETIRRRSEHFVKETKKTYATIPEDGNQVN